MPKKPQEHNREHVSNLLQIYRDRIKPPQASVEKEVVACIKKVTGIELQPEQVVYTVSSKTITLRVPSILKTEIKAAQEPLQACLQESLSAQSMPKVLL